MATHGTRCLRTARHDYTCMKPRLRGIPKCGKRPGHHESRHPRCEENLTGLPAPRRVVSRSRGRQKTRGPWPPPSRVPRSGGCKGQERRTTTRGRGTSSKADFHRGTVTCTGLDGVDGLGVSRHPNHNRSTFVVGPRPSRAEERDRARRTRATYETRREEVRVHSHVVLLHHGTCAIHETPTVKTRRSRLFYDSHTHLQALLEQQRSCHTPDRHARR